MMFQGVVVGLLDDGQIVLRTVLLHPLNQVAELGQREGSSSDLLAQARHEGLYPRGRGSAGQRTRRRDDDYTLRGLDFPLGARPSTKSSGSHFRMFRILRIRHRFG